MKLWHVALPLLSVIALDTAYVLLPSSSHRANRASTFATAVDPDAKCEPSDVLARAQREVDGNPLEQVDAALCLSDGVVFYCHGGYGSGERPKCEPLMDAHKKAKTQATAPQPAPTPAPPAAGSGSAR